MTIEGKSLGLALSGGGYRATLFGLGSLWRLNDAGLLGLIDRMSSVSGGSILMGILAHQWRTLSFRNGRATNFEEVVAVKTREFCSRTIDIPAGLSGILLPGMTAGDFLVRAYKKHLFGSTTIKDLPAAGPGVPKFVFYATNLQTGRSFRFRQDIVADYSLGTSTLVNPSLALTVAASSAFPPLFSPITLTTDPAEWSESDDAEIATLRRRILLTDGGVYDNMGLQTLVGKVDVLLVSDAGAPFKIKHAPPQDYVRQLDRVRDILIDQTRALRKRWLIRDFTEKRQRGAYWGIGTKIGDYGASPQFAVDTAGSAALEHAATRLRAFDDKLQGQLINWGYALCDAALRTHAALPVQAAAAWPVPHHPL